LSSASRASPSILDKLSGLSIPGPNLAVASELWRSQRGRRGQMRSLRTLQSPPTSLKPYSRLYCRMDFRGFGGHACHCFGQAVPPHPPPSDSSSVNALCPPASSPLRPTSLCMYLSYRIIQCSPQVQMSQNYIPSPNMTTTSRRQ
jgi:hypothetical protein